MGQVIGILMAAVLTLTCPDPPRSKAVVKQFTAANPCPEVCRIYVKENGKYRMWRKCGRCNVDHICPLACCGKDEVSNMQWLTVEENLKKGARNCQSYCK